MLWRKRHKTHPQDRDRHRPPQLRALSHWSASAHSANVLKLETPVQGGGNFPNRSYAGHCSFGRRRRDKRNDRVTQTCTAVLHEDILSI